ncbi:MAG: hypothetical protein GX197_01605 [Firmicutes bacterium]|jgi:hypothetical protein|nr:hypothetical protein [Clostridiales bacterium]NLM51504.1 hypothetical protein [Bacillota bacterium]
MLGGLLVGLAVGWILAMFGANDLLIQGVLELTGRAISDAGYYTILAFLGAIGGAINDYKRR